MAKPSVVSPMSKESAVLWQAPSTDDLIAEPAILIDRDITGLICITQEGRTILIEPTTVPVLLSELKRLSAIKVKA